MPSIQIEAIRPKKDDLPSRRWERTKRRVERALAPGGPVDKVVTKSFEKRVKNWETKITFKSKLTIGARRVKLHIGPYGRNKRIWIFVSGGTKGHVITAVKKRNLAIQSYTPKTRPGGSYGGAGVRRGPVTWKKMVRNPGIEPRNIEDYIAREVETKVEQILIKAILKEFRS